MSLHGAERGWDKVMAIDTSSDFDTFSGGDNVAPTAYELQAAPGPLNQDEMKVLDAWWRAANYLSVGQIFLRDNELLRRHLETEDIKPRLLGHWGTTPGLNLIYAHASKLIKDLDLNAVFVAGPGHGGPGPNACAWLEGTYSEMYPNIPRDKEGMKVLFRQFSSPGGVPSHCAPQTPGSFHEGGELGYSLLHAYGAVFDNPSLVAFCVVGDGEAETGPLATSWHANKFINPKRDGAVLPILHLNGYKIANPTLLARIREEDLFALMQGYGYRPHQVIIAEDENPAFVHQDLAAELRACLEEIKSIQSGTMPDELPKWPMLILRSPKGWTGPKRVGGEKIEGTFRAHQVPLTEVAHDAGQLKTLEEWMKSYLPEELFDENGSPKEFLLNFPPLKSQRMSANPVALGGEVAKDLSLPDFRDYGVKVSLPGQNLHEATRVLGTFLRDVIVKNPDSFLLFGPDEVASNRLSAVFEVTDRSWMASRIEGDDHLSPSGRVVEVLSEHISQGLLEGYLLTGRHGMFTCYEAFIHIVDAMFNQHAKWLEESTKVSWRKPLPSLNYLLTSHVWRQDHNGFSHQDPGFLDVVTNKKPEITRVYLPPDTNCLLSVADHCLRSRNYVNVIVAGKQPALDYLDTEEAVAHCSRGVGIWDWASNDVLGESPDIVMAAAGEIPTLEALAATAILREKLPDLKVRFVNVVDLMRLLPDAEHPHGLTDGEFDALFTQDKPIIFAFHGYPWLIHKLTYRRHNHNNLHVRGYKEEGTTTTPFDMVMLNDLDRYRLVMDVIDRVPGLGAKAGSLRQEMTDARMTARAHTREHGDDLPEITNFTWKS
ncbi:MAG: phosphoketolase family protein [Firmicutes bacterium]|nr:phosphoketolase family protein [Bacillota bacterium]